MEKLFSFLISVGLIVLGACIMAGPIWTGSPLTWALFGSLPAAIGLVSLGLAVHDAKIA